MALPRPPIATLSLRLLLIIPGLLAVATTLLFFFHSDVNIALLYSQCHAHARIPWLSRVPGLGPPVCFFVSYFHEALAAARSTAVLAAILAFVGGLLTAVHVEAGRPCNGPVYPAARPLLPLLVFNLAGGALVWELCFVPAFLWRNKRLRAVREEASSTTLDLADPLDPDLGSASRHLAAGWPDAVAIPVSVTLGFTLPSIVMLTLKSPVVILIWLFFPLYVSVIRLAVLAVFRRVRGPQPSLYLETSRPALAAVYGLPALLSVVAHGIVLFHLVFRADDRRNLTRATVKFIEIDFAFIALTVLYWVFVEGGWRVALVGSGVSALFGPGAGVCASWILREEQFKFVAGPAVAHTDDAEGGDDRVDAGERTALLQ